MSRCLINRLSMILHENEIFNKENARLLESYDKLKE